MRILQHNLPIVEDSSAIDIRLSTFRSQRLYGREESQKILNSAFETSCDGACLAVVINGYSGVGKTSLVHSCLSTMLENGARLACGKFDQMKNEHPLQGLVQAFNALVKQILCEPPRELDVWKRKIQTVVKDNGAVIIDMIPQLQLIIGPQPVVPLLDSHKTCNRFIETFRKFISVFTDDNHPLILFLDDLQWADSASIQFLRQIVCDETSRHLFFIAAYRNNEVDEAHIINELIADIQQKKRLYASIHLEGLIEAHVHQLIVDTFGFTDERALALADLCTRKTGGNPLFLEKLLQTLCDDGAIRYDETGETWVYDILDVERRDFSDNVAALLIHRLEQFPESTRQLLQLASCVGMQFSVTVLAHLCNSTIQETLQGLWPAMRHGLIEAQRGLRSVLKNRNEEIIFRFGHDHIQAASYSMWAPSDIPAIHLNICNALLSVYGNDDTPDHLFDLADQAALAVSQITDAPQRLRFARIFSKAASKSIGAGAYLAARRYCEYGIMLLEDNAWQQQLDLALELHHRMAESLYLSADFESAYGICEQASAHCENHVDRCRFHIIQIRTFFAQGELKAAIDMALESLAAFGIKIKKECSRLELFIQHLNIRWLMVRRGIKDILSVQPSNDGETEVLGTLYAEILIIAYRSYPKLFPVLILHFVRDIFSNSAMALTPLAVTAYAVLMNFFFNDLKFSLKLSEAAINACQNKGFETFKGRCEYTQAVALLHRKETIQMLISRMDDAFESCDNVGDTEWGTLTLYQRAVYRYFSGESLQNVEVGFADCEPYLFRHGHRMYSCYHDIYRQVISNLTCCETLDSQLTGAFMTEEIISARLNEVCDLTTGIFLLHMHKSILCYLKRDLERAVFHADEATPLLNGAGGHYCVGAFSMYMSLARIGLLMEQPGIPPNSAKEMLKRVGACQKRLKAWAKDAPRNYLNKYLLVEALRHQYLNKHHSARKLFVEAISVAKPG